MDIAPLSPPRLSSIEGITAVMGDFVIDYADFVTGGVMEVTVYVVSAVNSIMILEPKNGNSSFSTPSILFPPYSPSKFR